MEVKKYLFLILLSIVSYNLEAQQVNSDIKKLIRSREYDNALTLIKDRQKLSENNLQKLELLTYEVRAFVQKKKYEKAKSAFTDLVKIQNSSNQILDELIVRIYHTNSIILSVDKNYKDKTIVLKKATQIINRNKIDPLLSIQVYVQLANSYRNMKMEDSTFAYINKGLDLVEQIDSPEDKYYARVNLLNEKAVFYSNTSQNKKSKETYIQLLELAEAEKDSLNISRFNTNIAVSHFVDGDYGPTKYYLEKSMAINIEKYGPKHPRTLRNIQNLALAHTKLENYDNAEIYYSRYYDAIKETKGVESFEMGRLNFNLGMVHLQKKEFEKAIERFESSLIIRQKYLDPTHKDIAHCHQVIGSAYIQQKKFQESLPYFENALDIREKIGNLQDPELLRIHTNLALIYENQNRPDVAKSMLETAYKNNGYTRENNFDFEKVSNPFLMTELFGVDITLLTREYKNNPTEANYNLIRHQAKKIDTLITYMKDYLDDPTSRRIFRQKQKYVYDQAITAHLTKYDHDANEEAIALIFRLIEDGNNGMIYEKIGAENSSTLLGMPKEIIDQKRIIEDSLTSYENKIIENKEDPYIFNKIAEYKKKQYNLIKKIELEYPKYFQSILNFNIVSLSEYQSRLAPNETSITFYNGENSMLALKVASENSKIYNLGDRDLIVDQLTNFLSAVKDKTHIDNFNIASAKMYDLIVGPIDLDHTTHLTIIADGIFGLIPFGLIRESADKPFLFEKMTISHQYSATVKVMNKQNKNSQNGFLAIAPIFEGIEKETHPIAALYDKNENDIYRNEMVELKESENEIKAIRDLFTGQYLLRADATEATFKKMAPKSGFIHMATHGFVNHENPDRSRLYFYPDSTSKEDGKLNAFEIMNLDLSQTELVTLSACNTGVGAIKSGEGVASLGRAFAFAGCKNQLISLWPANDKSTTQLMSNYYTNLKKGQGKSTALQNAKLDYLSSAPEVMRHPYYWAGFVYYGEDTTIDISSSYGNLTLWIVLGTVFLLLIYFIIKSRAKA